jgi:hypothetical protein
MANKTKSKPNAEKKPDPAPAPKRQTLDLSCLGAKAEKQAGYFLEQASTKRQVDPEKILAACLNYCATLAQRRHGIHFVLQSIEQTTRCKIR